MGSKQPLSGRAWIPDDLKDRLSKADGHINATERRLWNETERGLWSAHQAVARIAEVWLRLEERLGELPEVEKYLPSDIMQARIGALEREATSGPLGDAWTELTAADAAIRAEPFSSPPNEDRASLEAGLARQSRYLDALRNLKRVVEDDVVARYISLRPGDWARLPDGHVGRLIDRRGLTGQFLIPDIAQTAPSQGIRLYALGYAAIHAIDPPLPAPVGAASWYWLTEAERRWGDVHQLINADWLTASALYAAMNGLLDVAAKAWWIAFEPDSRWVSWEHTYPQQHVSLLRDKAPDAIAVPLESALQRTEALHRTSISARGNLPPYGPREAAAILNLARQGIEALEDLLAPEVDLAPKEWIEVVGHGPGRIAFRHGATLIIDLGDGGVLSTSLFATRFRRIDPPEESSVPNLDRQHARWLWFACHPEDCLGRAVCPCCGLPGIEGSGVCVLCGWTHDGGDFGRHRRSRVHAGLNLDLGRRRFEALGYAVPPDDTPPGHRAAWLDPFVLAAKRRLVEALDALADHKLDDTGDPLGSIRALWRTYEERLSAETNNRRAPS
ncbi:MAG: hypothetical protein HQL36_03945 [Alphaproteobacteria bacterium]|nr:hypothetical protein [Alphaproteobacteria bacterium]